jgi:hypothetical protein
LDVPRIAIFVPDAATPAGFSVDRIPIRDDKSLPFDTGRRARLATAR